MAASQLELAEGELRFYREEGYLLLPGLLEEAEAAELRAEVLGVIEAVGMANRGVASSAGASGKLLQTRQYLAGGALDAYVNGPLLAGVAGQLLGGPCHLYMPFTAVKSGGGGGTFHFHQDNQYTHLDGPALNLWCALSPMTPENGCLSVVPRSHLFGTLESGDSGDGDSHRRVTLEPERFLPLRMRPGDAVAFSRLTVHGSGVNRTAAPRVGYATQFARDDVRALVEGEWRLLVEHPRWETGPVPALVPLEGRSDGEE